MPKPRAFDKSHALNQATQLFSAHGFEGTSLSMLTAELGVGKQSLYDTFGDKRALLSECLANSAQQFKPARWLQQPSISGRLAIEKFFAELVEESQDANHCGCLVTNLLLEKAKADEDIAREASHYWTRSAQALTEVCARGQADGSITATTPAAIQAQLLMTWMSGMRVSARAGHAKALKKTTAQLLNSVL
jgi:TetR/AcrR family transcriptional regulator, transcriptional repressor for nem operon